MDEIYRVLINCLLVVLELSIIVGGVFLLVKKNETGYAVVLTIILFLILCLHCSFELSYSEIHNAKTDKKLSKLDFNSMLKEVENSKKICLDEKFASVYKAYCTAIIEV